MNDIEAIKSRLNIVDVVASKVRLKKSGSNYFGLCPFHSEKSPSFSVNEDLQIFKCFGCGQSGDVISFVSKTDNLEFREALEILADQVGYQLTGIKSVDKKDEEFLKRIYAANDFTAKLYKKALMTGENPGKAYATKRQLSQKEIDLFGIGYSGKEKDFLEKELVKRGYTKEELVDFGLLSRKESGIIQDKFRNRLIFTIYDDKGRVVGFSGRFFDKPRKGYEPPKYLNSPETRLFKKSKLLFGLFQAQQYIRKLKFVVISEGQMNIISSHRVGVPNIVASLGTSFTPDHIKILRRYTDNFYLAFDKDSAGKKAMVRTLEELFKLEINVKIVDWDASHGKDPDELIAYNPKMWIEAVNNPIDPIEYIVGEFLNKREAGGEQNINQIEHFLKFLLGLIDANYSEIKKDYYLKYVSEKFQISKENLIKTMKSGEKSGQYIKPLPQKEHVTRVAPESNLFDLIFGVILQYWNEVKHLLMALEREFVPQKYLNLYDCLILFLDSESLSEIRENLEEAEQSLLDDLSMTRVTLDSNISVEEHLTKLIPLSKNEFRKQLVAQLSELDGDEDRLLEISNLLKKT